MNLHINKSIHRNSNIQQMRLTTKFADLHLRVFIKSEPVLPVDNIDSSESLAVFNAPGLCYSSSIGFRNVGVQKFRVQELGKEQARP